MRNPLHVVVIVLFVGLTLVTDSLAMRISSHYSPRNRARARRTSTQYIILHTTEGAGKGSLNKVWQYGEAHYFVETGGRILRIIQRDRIALHSGRSMWDGKRVIDNYSIGIEVVGYHNEDITPMQYDALRELIAELQRLYGIADDHVLTHSMVAYGVPNRWHRKSHRGRKRCGMLFAKRSVRQKLGLTQQPLLDPDVAAGRLVVADAYLEQVLYGSATEQEAAAERFVGDHAGVIAANLSAWDIARDQYNSAETLYVFPDGRQRKGTEITNWRAIPPGTRVVFGSDQGDNEPERVPEVSVGNSPEQIAGDEALAKTTIYFLPDGSVKQGTEMTQSGVADLPAGTRVLVGYVHGGRITARRSAFDVCGPRWKYPSTYYRFPEGSLRPGSEVDESAIPSGAMVFFQN